MIKLTGKHKNPIAAVYMLQNIVTGKIYIGETSDILNRMSTHRCTPRRKPKYIRTKIEKAIAEYGFDAFALRILCSSNDDPMIEDLNYRHDKEAEFIAKYNATDPEIGYNTFTRDDTGHRTGKRNYPTGILNTPETKIKLSKAVLAYDTQDQSVMLYCSAASYQKLHGLSDRSIITSALKLGKEIHGAFIFKLSHKDRKEDFTKNVERRAEILLTEKRNGKGQARKALRRYVNAMHMVNEWCEEYDYKQVNVDKILVAANITEEMLQ